MTSAYLQRVESLTLLGTKDYINKLCEDTYPELYDILYNTGEKIKNCEQYDEVVTLSSIYENICNELDELVRKEKYVLFPYILKLEEEGRKSENGKPIKNIKNHYSNVLGAINQFHDILISNQQFDCADAFNIANENLSEFEEMFTALQDHKERFLYRKFISLS